MSDRYAFSTGPIENQLNFDDERIAHTVWIKLENNRRKKRIKARVRVFWLLAGARTLIAQADVIVNPETCELKEFLLGDNVFQYEVQFDVNHHGAVVSVFSKDGIGSLVAAQRVLNSEFTPIHRLAH